MYTHTKYINVYVKMQKLLFIPKVQVLIVGTCTTLTKVNN